MSDEYALERLDEYERLLHVIPFIVRQRFVVGATVRISHEHGCGPVGVVDHYHGDEPDVVIVKVAGRPGDEPRYPHVRAKELYRLNPKPAGGV
jgi:hypothetical protein